MPLSVRRKSLLAATAFLLSVAAVTLANPGIVTLRDGTKYEGDVTEEAGVVTVKLHGNASVTVSRDKIAKIEYVEDVELEYNKRHANLADTEVDGRLDLAKYCFDHNRADLAKRVLAEALQIDPNNARAAQLYDAAKAQAELDRKKADRADPAPPEEPPERPADKPRSPQPAARERGGDESAGTRPALPGNHVVLDADQVNRVKQCELRDGDAGVTIKFENDVERRFAFSTGRTLGALRQLSPVDRFMLMRRETNWDMLKDVRIQRDPAPILEFRKFQPRILAGCASAACHGGENTNFSLVTPVDSEAATYTNFYFMSTHSAPVILASGAKASRRVIDRTIPEMSLLLQFCIDPKVARFPHPPVHGYRPLFRSPDEPTYAAMLHWTQYAITPLPLDYGFSFEERPGEHVAPIPVAEPATRPMGGEGNQIPGIGTAPNTLVPPEPKPAPGNPPLTPPK